MADLTIKVIQNLGHIGSSATTANHVDSLPKAAGKFNFLNNVTIKRKTNNSDDLSKEGKGKTGINTKNNSSVARVTVDATPEEAALVAFYLASLMEKTGAGSDKYITKKANFDTCKSKTLQALNAKSYDELSNEQRIEYAKRMLDQKAPFYYYQTVIHIKYDGKSTIFTKSSRSLVRPRFDETWINAQIDKALMLSSKFEVITRTVNKSNPNLSDSGNQQSDAG